jgi:hypothetical protein
VLPARLTHKYCAFRSELRTIDPNTGSQAAERYSAIFAGRLILAALCRLYIAHVFGLGLLHWTDQKIVAYVSDIIHS